MNTPKINVKTVLNLRDKNTDNVELNLAITSSELDQNLIDLLLEQGLKVVGLNWLKNRHGDDTEAWSGEMTASDLIEWFESTGGKSGIVDQFEQTQAEITKIDKSQAKIMERVFGGEIDMETAQAQGKVLIEKKAELVKFVEDHQKDYDAAIAARKERGQKAAETRKANAKKTDKKK